MATGTVQFQFGTIASPPPGLAVMADAVNDTDHGAGTAQYVKIMDGATGGTRKVGVSANGMAVEVFGTSQVLGSVQAVGTTQTRNAPGTLAPARSRVGIANGAITQLMGANVARVGFSLYAEGTAFHVQYGTTAGTFDYSFTLMPGAYFEDPYRHVGSMSAFSTAAGGSVMITEF